MLIRVVVKNPGQQAQTQFIENSLESFKEIVGGYLEALPIPYPFGGYCNEEGLLVNLTPNVALSGNVVVGPVVVFNVDREGNEVSLSEQEAQVWMNNLDELSY